MALKQALEQVIGASIPYSEVNVVKRMEQGRFRIGVEMGEGVRNKAGMVRDSQILVSLAHEDEASVGFVILTD